MHVRAGRFEIFFWAWHIKEDAAASVSEARRELMLRGWLGEKYFEPFLDADEIVVSPGVPSDIAPLIEAAGRGVSIVANWNWRPAI